jgi:hypothetical protein
MQNPTKTGSVLCANQQPSTQYERLWIHFKKCVEIELTEQIGHDKYVSSLRSQINACNERIAGADNKSIQDELLHLENLTRELEAALSDRDQ